MAKHPICEFISCNRPSTECHHKGGRVGERMFKDFAALCDEHHKWVEEHPKEAKELGYSISRLKDND